MFEYRFHTVPSSGSSPVSVLVHFLADRPDLAPTVASACFSEWTAEIVKDFGIPTAEAYVQEIQTNKMNTHAPFVLVASTAEVRERERAEGGERSLMWPFRWLAIARGHRHVMWPSRWLAIARGRRRGE